MIFPSKSWIVIASFESRTTVTMRLASSISRFLAVMPSIASMVRAGFRFGFFMVGVTIFPIFYDSHDHEMVQFNRLICQVAPENVQVVAVVE